MFHYSLRFSKGNNISRMEHIQHQHQPQQRQFFLYQLVLNSKDPCSEYILGKVKHNINFGELILRPDCYHNKDAYEQKLIRDGWANNFSSPISSKIFDCHFIQYTQQTDGIEFNIKILFFSLKADELLIPNVIQSDNMIITILRNHIMAENNLNTPEYQHYKIERFYESITEKFANMDYLDLRYIGHPACKTQLYPYQRGSIQQFINLESNLPQIKISEHKTLFLPNLRLIFDYNLSREENCFITEEELPKEQVYGGFIADEVGLGKTVQALNLALSRDDIRTLIIVPNHIKDHWISEMQKHFIGDPFTGRVLVVSVAEANLLTDDMIAIYQRVIVDEIAELYSVNRPENYSLFSKLCCVKTFQFRWGISATPFVDNYALYNIICFLIGKKLKQRAVGNYIYVQEQLKHLFFKNTKANVQKDVKLPEVIIHNSGLILSSHERAILTAMEMDSTTFSIDERLQVISNAMLAVSKNDKNVITVEELIQLTVQRFQEKITIADDNLKILVVKLHNVQSQIKESQTALSMSDKSDMSSFQHQHLLMIKQYQERERYLLSEIDAAKLILERRKTIHKSYLDMTQNIYSIIQPMNQDMNQDKSSDEEVECHSKLLPATGGDDDAFSLDTDKLCPVCYDTFTNEHNQCKNVVLFITCRHYFCQLCFETCHKIKPNTCPMCNTVAEMGEIVYIGLDKELITSTKNIEILKLLSSNTRERFLIFTRFDKFINPLTNFLITNNIITKTFDEFRTAPAHLQDETRVILLSSNYNASGIDMTFMHRVIIIEPFEGYIYGKEIEKQLIGRLHRINQIHDVHVHRLYIKDTIEEQIYSFL